MITDFNKKKKIDVASVSGTPTISRTVPFKITSGDDSTTGTGEIVLDWTNISSKADIGVYDENGNLLDYHFESFDATAETAVIWVYKDWVRDGSTQAQIAYGNGPSDQSVVASTVFDKEVNNKDLVSKWLLNESSGDALDVTSNNNDGTLYNGVTQGATGIVNSCYDFDGTDDYVKTGNTNIPYSNNPRTVGGWIYLAGDGSAETLYAYGSDAGSGNRFVLQQRDDGIGVQFNGHFWGTTTVYSEWTRIVIAVPSGASQTEDCKVYLNGQRISETDLAGDTVTLDTIDSYGPFMAYVNGTDYSDVLIDDVFVNDAEIAPEEETALYDATKSSPDFFSQQSAPSKRGNVFMMGGNKGISDIAQALNDATISAWNFDEGSGTTAFDEKNGNDGTLVNGPTWTTGKIGTALDFDGSNQRVDISNQIDTVGTELSISFWLNYDAKTSDGIISKRDGSGINNFQVYTYTNGSTLRFLVRQTDGNAIAHDCPYSNFTNGLRYHLVYTVKVGGQIKLYVNRINFGTNVNINQNIANDNIGTRFGEDWYGNYFDGKLDIIKIFNKALSQQEIDYLYNNGNGRQYPYS